MFGCLSAATELLSEEELGRYKACYCGLCRSLRERHGSASRMALSYDMCFLVLLLGSLYEPEEMRGEDGCAAHPFEKRRWWCSEITDYAADMNAALAYLKCRDDWHDEGSLTALASAGAMKKEYLSVKALYPRQCAAMESAIGELSELERQKCAAPDAPAAAFGRLMAEVLVFKEDRWSDVLRRMGQALGEFVYIMDACLDLDADTLRNRYNPLHRWYGLDNEERFRAMLRMLLGECVRWFDVLPLVQDAGILKNILCAGLWIGFNKKYSNNSKKGPSDGSGSV